MNSTEFAKRAVGKVAAKMKKAVEEKRFQKIASTYNFKGYKRIYLVHIRKAGGTSLNNMFLSLSGIDSQLLYNQLAATSNHRILTDGLIYVGWNVGLINGGNYFYAFSHAPLHKLVLPNRTFTVTCFRDPVERVISHYNMLMEFYLNKIDHPCMATEGKWLGSGFDDFLRKIPKEHLLNQLYMFSSDFNLKEAISNVQKLSHYFFIDKFENGICELNRKTGLRLEAIHTRKAKYHTGLSDHDIAKLREMLHEEYLFIDQIRELQ